MEWIIVVILLGFVAWYLFSHGKLGGHKDTSGVVHEERSDKGSSEEKRHGCC